MPAPSTNPQTITLSSGGSGYLSQSGVDLNILGNYTDTLVMTNQNTASVQMTVETGTVSVFVGSLQGSSDGIEWIDTGKTFTAAGCTTSQDVTIFKFLRVIVATANGAALTARVTINTKTIQGA